MRFVQNDDRGVNVTWYWCEPGALPGPYTIFASGNWSSDPIWPWLGPGEIKGAPRPWYNGANPWGFKGDHRCGTDEQFAEGLPSWPAPTEWKWCCQAYSSNPCLCFRLKPAEETPVVAPSYATAVEAIEFPRLIVSNPCLCWLPASSSPRLLAARSGYGSLPELRAPAIVSNPCLCWQPASVIFATPPRAYGYRSAPTSAAPHVSDPCLCWEPASVIFATPPRAYGYRSAPTSAAPHVSNPCLCWEPAATVTLRAIAYPYGSYATAPVAYTSNPCLCWEPGASVGLLPPSPYASGGSYGAPGGVLTTCCPGRLIPFNLVMDINGGASGQQCACLNGSYPISWGPVGWRTAVINPCGGGPLLFTLDCSNDPALCGPPKPWILTATDLATGLTQSVCGSFDCSSLVGTFNWGPVMIGQCQNIDFTPIIISIRP
jgi:hypothetical protein